MYVQAIYNNLRLAWYLTSFLLNLINLSLINKLKINCYEITIIKKVFKIIVKLYNKIHVTKAIINSINM